MCGPEQCQPDSYFVDLDSVAAIVLGHDWWSPPCVAQNSVSQTPAISWTLIPKSSKWGGLADTAVGHAWWGPPFVAQNSVSQPPPIPSTLSPKSSNLEGFA
jgi:hypothetical protein